ncbi:MAG: hypothetical protein IJL92_05765 [Thermoguttaceae bacterium]|nr:hypothetical protein [Thermoguttaceae bacterium]
MGKATPYQGVGEITFDMSLSEVLKYLHEKGLRYHLEKWPNKGCSPEVAWDIVRVGKDVSFFFARDRMFKIYFENGFSGSLVNGISLGMKIEEAETIDPTIRYDDWEEIYTSDLGYWLEDDVESGEIISISIFIKELENDEVFFKYEWCDRRQ